MRAAALAGALRARAPAARLEVVSDGLGWVFRERVAGVACRDARLDAGLVQPNGLDVDLAASRAAHEALVADWDARVAAEAAWLRGAGARRPAALVVADIPPLPLAAARRAGVRAVAVGNFSWDWVLRHYAESEPRLAPIAARYAQAYAGADWLYRLPLCADMPAFPAVRDAPLLVHRARRARDAVRAELGVPPGDRRRLVLVSFGGFGLAAPAARASGDLAGYRFVAFAPRPAGLDAAWHALPARVPIPHEELVAACDAVLGKPGYGTIAEALAHRVRFLYLPRDGFPEAPILVRALETLGCARPLPRADFAAGRWRPHLDALFDAPARFATLRCDGAETIAQELLAAL